MWLSPKLWADDIFILGIHSLGIYNSTFLIPRRNSRRRRIAMRGNSLHTQDVANTHAFWSSPGLSSPLRYGHVDLPTGPEYAVVLQTVDLPVARPRTEALLPHMVLPGLPDRMRISGHVHL
jgi:hypothetical protein